jgi:hypothetical protein
MSYTEQLQAIVSKYQRAGEKWPASAREIAQWAINKRLWAPQPSAIVNQCADELAKAMHDEYFTDPQGRRVRVKHAARYNEGAHQYVLWDDIRSAKPSHMKLAFQQRRQQILGDCKQLKNDVDSYNENGKPFEQIHMVYDFTLDLLESELARRRA